MRRPIQKAFTLLEILLVIAAIGILAATVIVAINPQRQLDAVRETTVISELDTLAKALEQLMIDTGNYDSQITTEYQDLCAVEGGQDCVDLYSQLVPTYIANIPVQPTASGDLSGYEVAVHPENGRISVRLKGGDNRPNTMINGFADTGVGSVEIINNASTALTDYQVRVVLAYQEGMSVDFSDVKFRDPDGDALDFWLDSYTESDEAIFWVKVPSIAGTSTREIEYIYKNSFILDTVSSVEDTFVANAMFLQTRLCNNETLCHFTDNHSEFEQLVNNQYPLFGSGLVNQVDHGSNPYGQDDQYWKRYSFLYVPTTTSTHTFRTSSDDASEIVIRSAGDLSTQQVVAHWYGGHGASRNCTSGTPGTYAVTAGEPVWIEYRMQEWQGGQLAYGCMDDGTGMRNINTDNFPGQLFARQIVYPEPGITVAQ